MAGEQEVGRGSCRDADEADPRAGPLDDRVRRQEGTPAAVDRVRGYVGKSDARKGWVGGVFAPPSSAALHRRGPDPPAPAQQPPELARPFVELVVSERPGVEPQEVERLDRRLVVEVAGDER